MNLSGKFSSKFGSVNNDVAATSMKVEIMLGIKSDKHTGAAVSGLLGLSVPVELCSS